MRSQALAAFLALIGALCTADIIAQPYPSRPVTIVVPFSAGGPTDVLARLLSDRMRKPLGQPVLVDNTTGAGGSIATGKVVRAAPAGYTVCIGHWGTHVVNGAYYSLPFDVLNDFAPVALIASNPQLIISKVAVPARDLKEVIAWINANPGRIKSVHLKDWAPGTEAAEKSYRVLFGEGVAPWKEILAAVESVGGIEFYLMEQEGSRYSEFETARRCLDSWRTLRKTR